MSLTLQNFYKTTITRNWSATTGDFNVSVAPTVSPGYIVVSPNNTTLREIVYYTATGSNSYGDFITVASVGDRGIGGTTAQTHTIGETVRMNITAEHWQGMQDDIDSIVAAGLPAGSLGDVMYHDGANWTSEPIEDLISEKTATITMSAADIIAMYVTPKELVAAPGSGLMLLLDEVAFAFTYNSVQFTGGGAVRIQYGGDTTNIMPTMNLDSPINAAATFYRQFNTKASAASGAIPIPNASLQLTNASAAFATGNSTMKIFIKYRIVTL